MPRLTPSKFGLIGAIGLVLAALLMVANPNPAEARSACPDWSKFKDSRRDVGPALQACIDSKTEGGEIALPPGNYRLKSILRITKSIKLTTEGAAGAAHCWPDDAARCATIHLDIVPKSVQAAWHGKMPIEIAAADVTFDRLIFWGSRSLVAANDPALCSANATKPLGGGIRVLADRFSFLGSSVFNVTCYTAMEVANQNGLTVRDAYFAANGIHGHHIWADGLTIHDGTNVVVEDSTFIDNTDVQLIFGGCRNCLVRNNKLLHTGIIEGGSFAALMLHAWPNNATSGQFEGTVVSGNLIDCATVKACGFGIMLGATPWYAAPTMGGTVADNEIRNAPVALNIDGLTGPMTVTGNRVVTSGGVTYTTCGQREAAAVNIAPGSAKFVDVAAIERDAGVTASRLDMPGCIYNYPSQ